MKKWMIVLLACSIGAANASLINKVFYSSDDDIKMACNMGTEVASMDRSKAEYLLNLFGGVKNAQVALKSAQGTIVPVSTPLYGVFNICYNLTNQLKPPPSVNVLRAAAKTRVSLYGEVKELSYARDWNVAIAFMDEAGQEIKRYFSTSKNVAQTDDWKVDCKDGCKWTGTNTYYFDTQKMEGFSEILAKSANMVVYASRGKGIEKYEVNPVLYPEFTQYDFTLKKLVQK